MKCPYCKEDMRAGYIQGGQGVIFSENEKSVFVYKNPLDKKDIKIAGAFSNRSPAFYCDKCECLIWKEKYGNEE